VIQWIGRRLIQTNGGMEHHLGLKQWMLEGSAVDTPGADGALPSSGRRSLRFPHALKFASLSSSRRFHCADRIAGAEQCFSLPRCPKYTRCANISVASHPHSNAAAEQKDDSL
jgi:hypothetical protein